MVKTVDSRIVGSEFELQLRYYVRFRNIYQWPGRLGFNPRSSHTLWERYKPPYPPIYGLNSSTTILLKGWIWY